MARAGLKVDITTNTITMTPSFKKKADIVGTSEYENLQEALRYCKEMHNNKFPTIETKGITKNENKIVYKNLNAQFIFDYVMENGTAEQIQAYDELTNDRDSIGKVLGAVPYGSLKSWFLKTFPEFKERALENQKRIQEGTISKETETKGSGEVIPLQTVTSENKAS